MKLRHLTTSALALILISGCGDDDGTGVEPDEIAGTWTATSLVFTQVATPMATADPVVDGGAVVTLVFDADGTYTFSFVLAPDPDDTEAGAYAVSGSTLTLTPTGETAETLTISRDGDTMTLTGSDTFEFDPLLGEEAATMVITLTR